MEEGQIRTSYICAVWRASTLGLVEYAIINVGLRVRPVVLLAGKELYPNLSLSLRFLPRASLIHIAITMKKDKIQI